MVRSIHTQKEESVAISDPILPLLHESFIDLGRPPSPGGINLQHLRHFTFSVFLGNPRLVVTEAIPDHWRIQILSEGRSDVCERLCVRWFVSYEKGIIGNYDFT